MDEEQIKKYIEYEDENEFLDFKLEPYDWSNTKSKRDFLSDVISFANSSTHDNKYIILGVKVKPNGERILEGIDKLKLKDSADYQQLVSENIEPSISIEVKLINFLGNDYGVIRIFNCNNKPYLLKKKYDNLESGYIKVRKGSRNNNINRYILDEIYDNKHKKLESKFKISGLINGKISDEIILNKYDFLPNTALIKEDIIKSIEEINKLKIDDIIVDSSKDKDEPSTFQNTIAELSSLFKMPTEYIKLEQALINNINSFSKKLDIKLNNDFFLYR